MLGELLTRSFFFCVNLKSYKQPEGILQGGRQTRLLQPPVSRIFIRLLIGSLMELNASAQLET